MIRRVTGIALTAVLAGMALLVIALVGVRLVGLAPYAVLSGSMEPLYPVGSLVYVRAVDPATIQPGDSVTFVLPSGAIATHQAYEVDTSAQIIRTQGIANKNTDGSIMRDSEPTPFSAVVGMPVAHIPLLGYVSVYSSTPPGLYLVIAVAVVLGIAFVLPSRFSGKAAKGARARRRRSQGNKYQEIEKGMHHGTKQE